MTFMFVAFVVVQVGRLCGVGGIGVFEGVG
jgi:hypothetical protein